MPDRVGQRLGNYRLLRLLGRGGFAEVYLGEHVRIQRQAAIKILHASLSIQEAERFQREAQLIASLEHPHIITLFDFDVEEGTPFLVMKYYPRGSVLHSHPRGTRLPLSTVITYIEQIADALQYAHDHKHIHRDVKPANMLVGQRNELVLSDFGIAAIAHSTSSMSVQALGGTPSYMAPEQIEEYPRAASDQYALAVVAYEWLTGTPPFSGTAMEISIKHLSIPPPPLRKLAPDLSAEVEEVILTSLAKDPSQRFGSIRAFAHAFAQAGQERISPSSSAAPPAPNGSSPISIQPVPPILVEQVSTASVSIREKEVASKQNTERELQDSSTPPTESDQPESHNAFSHAPTLAASRAESSSSEASTVLASPHPSASLQEPLTWVSTQKSPSPVSPPPVPKPGRQPRHRLFVLVALLLVVLIIGAGVWISPQLRFSFGRGGDAGTGTVDTSSENPYGGTLLFSDSLSDNQAGHQWTEYITSTSSGLLDACQFSDGIYRMAIPGGVKGACYADATDLDNFVYEIEMTFVQTDAESAGGLIIRQDKANNCSNYALIVYADGRFIFDRCQTILVRGESLPHFRIGLHEWNTLTVVARGDAFECYVNGHLAVGPLNDNTYAHGAIGVLAFGDSDTAQTEVWYRNVKVWQL